MKPAPGRLPAALAAGLLLAIVLDTFVQLAWKRAASDLPDGPVALALATVARRPLFWAAMLAFAAQLWNWLRVLARADLSFAQPITALSYLSVLGLSALLLHEHVTWTRGVGAALVLAGVGFITRTPHRTGGADRSP